MLAVHLNTPRYQTLSGTNYQNIEIADVIIATTLIAGNYYYNHAWLKMKNIDIKRRAIGLAKQQTQCTSTVAREEWASAHTVNSQRFHRKHDLACPYATLSPCHQFHFGRMPACKYSIRCLDMGRPCNGSDDEDGSLMRMLTPASVPTVMWTWRKTMMLFTNNDARTIEYTKIKYNML